MRSGCAARGSSAGDAKLIAGRCMCFESGEVSAIKGMINEWVRMVVQCKRMLK